MWWTAGRSDELFPFLWPDFPYSSCLARATMPPKNAQKGGAAQSKKADQKKKDKIIEVCVLCCLACVFQCVRRGEPQYTFSLHFYAIFKLLSTALPRLPLPSSCCLSHRLLTWFTPSLASCWIIYVPHSLTCLFPASVHCSPSVSCQFCLSIHPQGQYLHDIHPHHNVIILPADILKTLLVLKMF